MVKNIIIGILGVALAVGSILFFTLNEQLSASEKLHEKASEILAHNNYIKKKAIHCTYEKKLEQMVEKVDQISVLSGKYRAILESEEGGFKTALGICRKFNEESNIIIKSLDDLCIRSFESYRFDDLLDERSFTNGTGVNYILLREGEVYDRLRYVLVNNDFNNKIRLCTYGRE